MIDFKINAESFIEYLYTVQSDFYMMVNTMRSVALLIELNTVPYVPLDTSALEQSYEYKIMESINGISMFVGYDAVDPETGFHYAEYQHEKEDLHHPRRGIPKYLYQGILDSEFEVFEMIETDYLSLFGGSVMSSTTGSIH